MGINAEVKDATAAPKHPQFGYGYTPTLINYAFLAHAVLITDDAVKKQWKVLPDRSPEKHVRESKRLISPLHKFFGLRRGSKRSHQVHNLRNVGEIGDVSDEDILRTVRAYRMERRGPEITVAAEG